jgi:hypothetical protein
MSINTGSIMEYHQIANNILYFFVIRIMYAINMTILYCVFRYVITQSNRIEKTKTQSANRNPWLLSINFNTMRVIYIIIIESV